MRRVSALLATSALALGAITAAAPAANAKAVGEDSLAALLEDPLADPFQGMQFGDNVREKKVRREAPSYLTSCGLAMRRFLQ